MENTGNSDSSLTSQHTLQFSNIFCAANQDGNTFFAWVHKYDILTVLFIFTDRDNSTLGSNGYKEVARVSTHTILAAYGFEHHQALARLFSWPLCNHNKDMSNLVPSCCRDCFSTFVRQVVKSVLLEKMWWHMLAFYLLCLLVLKWEKLLSLDCAM